MPIAEDFDRILCFSWREVLTPSASSASVPFLQVRVLSGEEEGAFGWLALNQLQAPSSGSLNCKRLLQFVEKQSLFPSGCTTNVG